MEAVFTAILGDPPESLESCSDEEHAALARALGIDSAALAREFRLP